jgi:hypothetical protein
MKFFKIYKTIRTRTISVLLSFVLSCVCLNTFSSDSLSFINDLTLSARVNHGFIYPHHNAICYLLKERITGCQISLTTQTYGRTIYDKLYRYPRFGIGYLYTSLGNDEIFGKGHSLFLFMDITALGQNRKLSLNYEIDFGAGYVTKQFDPENNLMNIAISSHYNIFVGLSFNLAYQINNRNELTAGYKFFHFSNGKIGTPNLGLNAEVISLGYNYRIKPLTQPIREAIAPTEYKRHFYELAIAAGGKADDQVTDKHYFVSSLVFDYKYFPKFKYGFGAGADLFYDQSLGPNKTADLGGTYNSADLYQFGIHAGVYSRFSRLIIMLHVGDYLYATYCKYASFYSRIGFRYMVTDHLLFNFSLKSHYAIADFMEWGFAYSF